ncbi:uncharacterized protein [Tenebrio molitor]|uniref:uncharacterized protein isoform X2 n=1 Tax=Tenebrio molitor TaxID=7067 RepID=UPI0036249202
MTHPQADAPDFYFYVKCAKPLIVALPSGKDRGLASAWIKRLAEDVSISDDLKNNYLKLLIYFLQKRELDGPFLEHPANFQTLTEFPKNQNLFEATKALKKKPRSGKPFTSDYSGDLRISPAGIKGAGLSDEDEPTPSQSKEADPELERKKNELAEKLQKKAKSDNKKVMFLVSPIGIPSKSDERVPPSWGSNLIQADLDDKQTNEQ